LASGLFRDHGFFEIDPQSASPQMAGLIARKDWSQTPLGPPESWAPSLRTILQVALANRFPVVFWWGPEFIQLYNDPYIPMLGAKHPKSLGQTAQECWGEIWDVIGPQITSVYGGGPSTWNEDLLLDVNRHGFIEETYFTFSYSPLPDPSAPKGIGGVMGTVQETSEKVVGERRMTLLRDLATRSTEAKSAQEECLLAVDSMARHTQSLPFSLIYLADEGKQEARLAASAGVENAVSARPAVISLTDPAARPWPLATAAASGDIVVIDDLASVLDVVPPGHWPEPPRSAVIVPIQSALAHEVAGFFVAGVNPRRALDERYRGFFRLVAGQIASAVSSARAYEAERKRAEALAEIDRAKIVFFSNVSHEFRTPLTLMLGPLAELSRGADDASRPLIEAAHRNALRLLKLVNTLLEFSRLEAGRHDALFAQTDLSAVTQDLCAIFRPAIEAGGLRFAVDVDADVRAYVDRSMWEKIVLNLFSNALKFTLAGEIRVTLREREGAAVFGVADTGVGIAASEKPHLFERFRRVRGAKSRSHEGTGIGLALVDELVRLHGGSVEVDSEIEKGSTFRVLIPLGREHLDPSSLVPETAEAPYASVVEQYLAEIDSTVTRAALDVPQARRTLNGARDRILIADDNGDLRAYVSRLLADDYDVVTVRNGAEALRAAREERFDLIVSDAMMPEMDGFELLATLKEDPTLARIPFIMLSARAGEEAAIEGLTLGADAYLSKPFTSEELLARVHAHLNSAAVRERAMSELRTSEERFRTLATSLPHVVIETDPSGSVTFLSDAYAAYTGVATKLGGDIAWESIAHPDDARAIAERWAGALRTGESLDVEFRFRRADGTHRWHVARGVPQRGSDGSVLRWIMTVTDVHDMRRAVREREFLSEASRVLSESLDPQTVMQHLAKLTLPRFADWCQVNLAVPDGRLRTVALSHRDPEKNKLGENLVGRVHYDPSASRGSPYVVRTGSSDLIEDAASVAEEAIADARELRVYRELGLRSAVCVPLVSNGKALGTISFVYAQSLRRYSWEDVPVLEELGRRAGIAIQRASEFEREHRVAESFQEASLPPALPDVLGVRFDAVYVPGSDEAQIGGDWYDAVRLFDGRVVISIGDVTGHGLRAAVTMGNIRQIIRGIAQVHANPALMLDAADRALRLEHPDEYVTAFVGVLDPIAGTLAYACAGHPPPMLRHPNGDVDLLTDGGLPLGLRESTDKGRGKTIFIPDGSHLVFYTDGLTEIGREPVKGEQRLRTLLSEGSLLLEKHPAWSIKEAFFDGIAAKDDVAILVASIDLNAPSRRGTQREIQRWTLDVSDERAARAARHGFVEGLRARGASRESVYAAEVVFGELVGNAARYAPGPIGITVDWSGTAPVLHVVDEGPGFHHIPALPSDVYSESGRGLFLISELSQDFHVTKRPTGGSHARAVLSLRLFSPS
jgi:PAS domain S-box-containing protein